jgi:hypothetical protein
VRLLCHFWRWSLGRLFPFLWLIVDGFVCAIGLDADKSVEDKGLVKQVTPKKYVEENQRNDTAIKKF